MPPRYDESELGHGKIYEADYARWATEQYGTQEPPETHSSMSITNAMLDLHLKLRWKDRFAIRTTKDSLSESLYPTLQSQLSCTVLSKVQC